MPQPGSRLLDTSLILDMLAGEEDLAKRLEGDAPVYVSAIGVGELEVGFQLGRHAEEERAVVEAFLLQCTVIPVDLQTAQAYATIKVTLRRQGRPIPENDVWIAATALQHQLVLTTRDADHFAPEWFSSLPTFAVEIW